MIPDGLPAHRPCLCRSVRDQTGRCMHCDYPAGRDGSCPATCVSCARRDRHCVVCHMLCVSPAAARAHQEACRRAEVVRIYRQSR